MVIIEIECPASTYYGKTTEVSRVPCVGEKIYMAGKESGRAPFIVTDVIHELGVGRGCPVATVIVQPGS